MLAMLKIAVVTDIHYGLDQKTQTAGNLGLDLLQASLDKIENENFDLLVDLGDRLNDKKTADARACLKELALIFRNIRMPRHHILGNCDILDVQKQEKILGTTLTNHSITMSGWHFLFLSSYDSSIGGNLDNFALNWLERELAANNLPKIIFTHQPLDEGKLPENRFFSDDISEAYSKGSDEARKIIEKSGKVKLVISGHLHQNKISEVNGISYCTITALTPFRDSEEQELSYAVLKLDDKIYIDILGREKFNQEIAI